jgi:arsenate reductase
VLRPELLQLRSMTTHVLILCTHNSARSVLAEAMLNDWAQRLGKDVRAYSAGSAPSGRINPAALAVLGAAGIETSGFRSKNWDEFSGPDSPRMRIVITVCDNAAAEPCPLWPGAPVRAHWSYPDPSNAPEADRRNAFELTRQAIGYRMLQLVNLPFDQLSDDELRSALAAIAAR